MSVFAKIQCVIESIKELDKVTRAFNKMPLVVLHLNLSARQFRHRDFAGVVKKVLQEAALDPKCLELELTEGVPMQEVKEVAFIQDVARTHIRYRQ